MHACSRVRFVASRLFSTLCFFSSPAACAQFSSSSARPDAPRSALRMTCEEGHANGIKDDLSRRHLNSAASL